MEGDCNSKHFAFFRIHCKSIVFKYFQLTCSACLELKHSQQPKAPMCLSELAQNIKLYLDHKIKLHNYLIFNFLGLIISLLRQEHFSFLSLTVSKFSFCSLWFQNKVAHYQPSIPPLQHCPQILGAWDIKGSCQPLKLTLTTKHIRKALNSSKSCPTWHVCASHWLFSF